MRPVLLLSLLTVSRIAGWTLPAPPTHLSRRTFMRAAQRSAVACASADEQQPPQQQPLAGEPASEASAPEAPAPEAPAPAPVATYADAEERGFELYKAGEFERAIRMFELAQTLPGAGVDYTREKQSGMIGSATAPPNPRGMKRKEFATPQQKLIAQYNIACCYAALGDVQRTIEIIRAYLQQVRNPIDQVNEMIVDEDLAPVKEELLKVRAELKEEKTKNKVGLFGLPIGNPLRDISDSVGVEWKD